MSVMRRLEPIEILKETIIQDELEEINCVYFLTNGVYEIGYEINAEHYFKISYKNNNVIGAFEINTYKKSEWIYKTVSKC